MGGSGPRAVSGRGRGTSTAWQGKSWKVEVEAPPLDEPRRVDDEGNPIASATLHDPDAQAPMMSAEQASALAGRCARTRPTMASLPRGTHVMDFATCIGCDCCLPDGAYPFGSVDDRDASADAL